MKKFYVNRLHIGLEALGSWAIYSMTTDIPEDYSDIGDEEESTISSIGLTLNGNLELALGYDINIGGGVSYRMFVPTDDWTYKVDSEEIDLSEFDDISEFDFSGVGFQIYLTWSLPALGYDPVAAARGAIGY